eukprot:6247154-Pyramimonas_sp.AAC.1
MEAIHQQALQVGDRTTECGGRDLRQSARLRGGFIVGFACVESVGQADYLTVNYQNFMRIAEAMRYYSAPL